MSFAKPLDDRVARARRLIDVTRGRGLEVGPLYAPMVTRDEADVRYVDIHFAPELRADYASHPGIPVDEIVEVDFALIHEGEERSLAEAVAAAAPFDWIIASHVIEHVPDVVGWLADLAEILADGGRVVLAVPDRRFSFDALRPPTTVGEMLRAHLARDTRPSARAVFDHFSSAVDVSAEDLWRGDVPTRACVIHGNAYAWERVQAAVATRAYVDCHVWLFTPGTFVDQLRTLGEIGLLDLTLADLTPAAVGELEFFVSLQRVPRGLDADAHRVAVLSGFPDEAEAALLDTRPVASPSAIALSAREQRAVMLKRAVFGRVRARLAKMRTSRS
jgi:SAM-dependent methyltransferase